jgi:uncharacterized delta-60 repeat protein
MKTLSFLTLLSFSLYLNAQDAGDLNLNFNGNGIYIEDWPDTTTLAQCIGVLSDGSIIIEGSYKGITDGNDCVLKMDPEGNFLPFGNFPRGYELDLVEGENIKALFILPDDKILVAGDADNVTYRKPFVMRLLPTGQPDLTFGEGGLFIDETIQMSVTDVTIYKLENSYKIILCGQNADPYTRILMLTDDGVIESSFGSDGMIEFNDHRARVEKLAIDNEDNSIFASGYILDGIGTIVLKYTLPDGTSNTDFGTDGVLIYPDAEGFKAQTFTAAIDTEENTLTVFGKYEHAAGDYDMFAYRIHSDDGSADESFGISGWSSLRSPVSNEVIS